MSNLNKTLLLLSVLSPVQTGDVLTATFRDLEARAHSSLLNAYREILQHFGLSVMHPLAEAGAAIATLIDQPVADGAINYGGHGNGYHNKNHMVEVLVSAAALLALHAQKNFQPVLSADDQLLLLMAALAHDLGHDGRGNGQVPLRLEKIAVELARPFLDRKIPAATFAIFEALIYATDISGKPAPEVIALLSAPPYTTLRALLQDADLLPSIGLTWEWAVKQNERLAREEAAPAAPGAIDWAGTLWFYENRATLQSEAGQLFAPNFAVIKACAARQIAHKPNPLLELSRR